MEDNSQILEKLTEIATKLDEQNMLKKAVLTFEEACTFLDVSQSHLYKLTSAKQIPHFCPQGKKLYFRRDELEGWLLRNRQSTADEVHEDPAEYTRKGSK